MPRLLAQNHDGLAIVFLRFCARRKADSSKFNYIRKERGERMVMFGEGDNGEAAIKVGKCDKERTVKATLLQADLFLPHHVPKALCC